MKKILIVSGDYYKDITKGLLNSALKKIPKNFKVKIIKVPGVLGCVIKGQTPHFDFISSATTNAIMEISINNKKPVGNGIITCLNFNQAVKRKFKGKEAVEAVLSILSQ